MTLFGPEAFEVAPDGGSSDVPENLDLDTHQREHDDGLFQRWQTLQLLAPVFAMVERSAPRADFDHDRYDLPQLALRAIDFIVLSQASVDGFATPNQILDHLTLTARRMAPDDPQRPWERVAKLVLNSLLNDGRPHVRDLA